MFDAIFPKHWTTLQRLMWLKTNALARAVYETITGNPVSFTAKAAPLRQLKVAFSPVQSGTGDPSPDNVRPISGWSSLTVEQTGKNLLNPDISAYSTNTNYRYLNGVVPVGQAARFTFTDKDTSVDISGCYIGFTDTDLSEYGTVSHSKWVIENGVEKTNATNITGSGGTIIMSNVFIYPKTQETFDKLFARYNIMVELGTTASSYQPFNPLSRSISISLGQTVYSGWVDVVTGVVTVTWASETYNGTEAWGRDPLLYDTARFFLGKNEMKKYVDYTSSPYIIFSNRMPTVKNYVDFAGTTYLAVTGYSITSNLQNYVYVMSHYAATGIETVDQLKAWLANNPLQVCYELATPLTIQLTPQEVQSLAGDNTMWSNANQPLTVTYRSN